LVFSYELGFIRLFGVTRIPKPAPPVTLESERMDEEYLSNDDFNIMFEDNSGMRSEEEPYSVPVCVNVHGFVPYFYAAPIGLAFEHRTHWTENKIRSLVDELNDRIRDSVLRDLNSIEYHDFVTKCPDKCVLRIEVVESSQLEEGVYHLFQRTSVAGCSFVILKIFCSLSR
jgi:hypothetical protein